MESFNRLLDEYKNQYLQFLATGEESYRVAYNRAMEGIEEAISSKREIVDADKAAMKHFAASYEQTNKELADTVSSAKNAQEAHDQYVTSKDRYSSWSAPTLITSTDVSVGYDILLRIGIFLILLPIFLYISYFTSGMTNTSYRPYRYDRYEDESF